MRRFALALFCAVVFFFVSFSIFAGGGGYAQRTNAPITDHAFPAMVCVPATAVARFQCSFECMRWVVLYQRVTMHCYTRKCWAKSACRTRLQAHNAAARKVQAKVEAKAKLQRLQNKNKRLRQVIKRLKASLRACLGVDLTKRPRRLKRSKQNKH